MSADLYIHVYGEGELTEDDFRVFFSSTIGSKWFDFNASFSREEETAAFNKFSDIKGFHVGEVSWLKYAITQDEDYVPDLCGIIAAMFDDVPLVITEDFVERTERAIGVAQPHHYYYTSQKDELLEFLRDNIGKKAYTVSW